MELVRKWKSGGGPARGGKPLGCATTPGDLKAGVQARNAFAEFTPFLFGARAGISRKMRCDSTISTGISRNCSALSRCWQPWTSSWARTRPTTGALSQGWAWNRFWSPTASIGRTGRTFRAGVISGASLVKPDYMELKKFPFLWYQTEYVIGGAATYIFDVLAAEKLVGSLTREG